MDSSVRRPRVKGHLVEVVEATNLTSWYRRLTMDAKGLFEVYDPAPGAYLQLDIPTDGGHVARSYSLHGVTESTFLLEFVLHVPSGPGCEWAASARPGTTVAVSEPPYSLEVPDASHGLLVADASALAGLASLMENVDERMALTVLVEDAHPDCGMISLPGRKMYTPVNRYDSISAEVLGQAAAGLDPGNCFLWAAGERRLAKTVREFVRAGFAVPRTAQHIQTYWIAEEGR